MDQNLRNKLRGVVTQCRRLLEDAVALVLEGQFSIYAGKKDDVQIQDDAKMGHLSEEDRRYREQIIVHLEHIQALGYKSKYALAQLVREVAFTHLNRLCAYKMMEARGLIRETVSRGLKSQGFLFYLADHDDDEKLHSTGHQHEAYRHFLNWLGGTLSEEIGVLFSPHDPANRLFPPQRVLDDLLGLVNSEELKDIWTEDEVMGWVYQYFTPKELRDQARKESAAPRNSYELAFRNQFFTPRYVVEFLTDNTLGRIWYEMQRGNTKLKDRCRYMVRRPTEVFLSDPIAEARHLGMSISKPDEIPASVQAAYRGDFASAVVEKDGVARSWMAMAVPLDQYEAATGHPFREGHDHPTVNEVWNAVHEHPETIAQLHPLKILIALSELVRTASGGPYAAKAANELWAALTTAVKAQTEQGDHSQEELLKQPVCIPNRPKKDPREIKILDPACGSGHFLLYCFDLFLVIYEEAYTDPDLGPALKKDYPTLEALRRAVPGLILSRNLHGIDIDFRATQIAALALWLRAQRAYHEMGVKKDRPKITRSNIVCAEPMPGEKDLLDGFLKTLHEDKLEALIRRVMKVPAEKRIRATAAMADRLCELVRLVWEKMQLAGEAGSLLMIEEELQEAIREGQEEFEEKNPLFRITEYSLTEQPSEHYYRFVPGDVEGERVSFWDMAERLVLAALQDYTAYAANGNRLQRQLFVEDAVRGFAFVDLCCQRFDVALMNPPFGEGVLSTAAYMKLTYPASKNDLYASFVERGLALLNSFGTLGAITSRVGFFASTLLSWRQSCCLGETGQLHAVADLGHGVLDAALVEAAAYIIDKPSSASARGVAAFISALDSSDKGMRLLHALDSTSDLGEVNWRFTSAFTRLPGAPLAYWLPATLGKRIAAMQSLSYQGGKAAVGLQTDDDFRFLRLFWEVPPETIGARKRWVHVSKGGEYSPYYDDLHLLLLWENDGAEIKSFVESHYAQWSKSIRNVELYFKSGLTYPERTTSDFSPRPLPKDAIFSIAGPAIFFSDKRQMLAFLGFSYSRMCKLLLEVFIGQGDAVESGSAARHYKTGILNALPLPTGDPSQETCNEVTRCVRLAQFSFSFKEETLVFVVPGVVHFRNESLKASDAIFREAFENNHLRLLEINHVLDTTYARWFGFSASDMGILEEQVVSHPCDYPMGHPEHGSFKTAYELSQEALVDSLTAERTSRHLTKKSFFADRKLELLCHKFKLHPNAIVEARRRERLNHHSELSDHSTSLFSYCVGVTSGRWDVRLTTGDRKIPEKCDPFDPLPACSPGMLTGSDGLPAKEAPFGYPLRIDCESIMVDDPDHSDDIVRRVREVLELIWKDRADAIEKEACDILGVKELRDYFRKPGSGGFWDDHVKRYSKSRRKAPIYWLLQSSKKNYALWLYYHRLDKDILFKALQHYVEPKIRLEDDDLKSLRAQRTGATGKVAKDLDKKIEKKDALLSELHDFEEKLRRAANLHLEPDLNDGVVLNIAPLWELVPWKEAKAYWQELLAGEYEWSTIGKQLRQKGVIK